MFSAGYRMMEVGILYGPTWERQLSPKWFPYFLHHYCGHHLHVQVCMYMYMYRYMYKFNYRGSTCTYHQVTKFALLPVHSERVSLSDLQVGLPVQVWGLNVAPPISITAVSNTPHNELEWVSEWVSGWVGEWVSEWVSTCTLGQPQMSNCKVSIHTCVCTCTPAQVHVLFITQCKLHMIHTYRTCTCTYYQYSARFWRCIFFAFFACNRIFFLSNGTNLLLV